MLKIKDTIKIVGTLTLLLFVQQIFADQLYFTLESNLPIKYVVTANRFETPPIHLRVGVFRFEDVRTRNKCNIIFDAPLNKGFTQSFVEQLSQSNVFDEVKEIPPEILKKYENCKFNRTIAKEIGDKLKVDVLLFGRIEELTNYYQYGFPFFYKWRIRNKCEFIIVDINSYSAVWGDKFDVKSDEVLNSVFFYIPISQVVKSSIKTIQSVNEGVQTKIVKEMTDSNTRISSFFMPNVVLNGNIEEWKSFLKLQQEKKVEGNFNIALYSLPMYLVSAFSGVPWVPVVVIPTWLIVKNIKEKEKMTEKKRIFFEEELNIKQDTGVIK